MKGSILVTDAVERRYAERLERAAPGVPRVLLEDEPRAETLTDVEVVYFSGDLFPDRMRPFLLSLREVPRLGWMHTFSAGVDGRFFEKTLERGARLSTSSGAQAVPIAHTVMLYLLALTRDLPGWHEEQKQRVWRPRNVRELEGLRLCVVGLGPIGLEVARLGAAFGMDVVGVRRTPRGDEPCQTVRLDALGALLPSVDALVLALPLSEETQGLIDAPALAAMKNDALLVNVGRGGLVDERALCAALRAGELGGAGLDVFEVEPLPEESPLWELPNVIVTPHSSGTCDGNDARATEIFLDNLARYVRGEPLRNEVPPPEAR